MFWSAIRVFRFGSWFSSDLSVLHVRLNVLFVYMTPFVIASSCASTREFELEYSRVRARVLASSSASTREFVCEFERVRERV